MSSSSAAPAASATSQVQFSGREKSKDVRSSNIIAARAIADLVRTSLGPRGMDKLLQTSDGQHIITNDGATILSKIETSHPAAKMVNYLNYYFFLFLHSFSIIPYYHLFPS